MRRFPPCRGIVEGQHLATGPASANILLGRRMPMTTPSDPQALLKSPFYYEIRVVGLLPPEALLDFDRLTASVEPVETVLYGPLRDQAALRGLLARFETFGIQIQEVRRLYTRGPSESGQADEPGEPSADERSRPS
jgi:hypothetical protein